MAPAGSVFSGATTAGAAGKGDEYEVAMLVLKYQMETEAGRAWPAKAHIAAGARQDRSGAPVDQRRAIFEGWGAHSGIPAYERMSQGPDAEIEGPVLI